MEAPSGATPSFSTTPPRDHELVERLDLDRGDEGRIQVDQTGQTSIPGLYAAGDLCTFAQVTLAISTGAVAGSAASMALGYEDLARRAERR
ncbi:MAG: FAD-dependent oxidoreductase [Solirubrobacteraceae bacterium]